MTKIDSGQLIERWAGAHGSGSPGLPTTNAVSAGPRPHEPALLQEGADRPPIFDYRPDVVTQCAVQTPVFRTVVTPLPHTDDSVSFLPVLTDASIYYDIAAVKGFNTPSRQVEIAVLSGLGGYESIYGFVVTQVPANPDYVFTSGRTDKSLRDLNWRHGRSAFVNDYRHLDIAAIAPGVDGSWAMQILKGSDAFSNPAEAIPLPLSLLGRSPQFFLSDVNGDLVDDLHCLSLADGPGKVRLQIVSGASGYSEIIRDQHIGIGDAFWGPDFGQFLVGHGDNFDRSRCYTDQFHPALSPLLYIKKQNTGTCTTEVHAWAALQRSQALGNVADDAEAFGEIPERYTHFSHHAGSALPNTDRLTRFLLLGCAMWRAPSTPTTGVWIPALVAVQNGSASNRTELQLLDVQHAAVSQRRCDNTSCDCNDLTGNPSELPILGLRGHRSEESLRYGKSWFTAPRIAQLTDEELVAFRELLSVGNVDDFIKRCRDLERITRKPPRFEHAVQDNGKWIVRYVGFWPVHHWVPKREVISTLVEEASVLPCSAIPVAEMVRVTSGGARYFQWLHCLKSDADPIQTSDGLHLDATLSAWFVRAERARNDLNPATGGDKPYEYEFSEERFANTNQWRCSLYDREHFRSRWEPALKHPEASKRTHSDMVAEALKAAQALCKPDPYEALVRHLASSSERADKVSIDDLFMAVAHAVAGRDVATGILL